MAQSLRNMCESVDIGGQEYRINTDFRVWIEIEHLLFDNSKREEERLAEILVLGYPVLPQDPFEAVKKIVWFYSGGEFCEAETEKKGLPAYDLVEDFDYVWGAFRGEFGIDLTKENMHWWKFRVLLSCLGDGCFFSKIVGYRSMDTSGIKNKEQRRFYEQMKKRFALKRWKDPYFLEAQLADKLMEAFE